MENFKKNRFLVYLICFIIPVSMLLILGKNLFLTNLLGETIYLKAKVYYSNEEGISEIKYDLEEINQDYIPKKIRNILIKQKSESAKVYVLLKKNKNIYDLDSISLNEPKEGIYLTGKYEYSIANEKDEYTFYMRYYLDKEYSTRNKEKLKKNQDVIAKLKIYKGYALLSELVKK